MLTSPWILHRMRNVTDESCKDKKKKKKKKTGSIWFERSHPVVYVYIHFITIYCRQHNYNRI